MTGDAIVLAHTFGERYELPIPQYLFVLSGALVVVLSFVLVLRRGPVEGEEVDAPDVVPRRALSPVPALVSLVATLLVAVVGMTGTQDVSTNLAPLFFWVLLWIAVPLTCGVLGDWTKAVNPFGNVARLGDDPQLRRTLLARKEPLVWSPRLAWWPALGLFVLLVLGELVYNGDAVQPAFVGSVIISYLVLSFVLGLLFGPSWLERGEVFSALYDLWGRLGVKRFGAPGKEGYAGGLEVPFERTASRTVFVLLLLVSINFDGLLSTPGWQSYERRTYGADSQQLELFRTLSLAGVVVATLLLLGGFAWWSARLGRHGTGPVASLSGLLPSLVPIAFGYLIAHNLQYLMVNLQTLYPLVKNPGYGDTSTSFQVNTDILPPRVNWYVSLVVIVAVHVIAVVLAHRHLARTAADGRSALRSELPWLVAMVLYTAFSIYLIAQPLTEAGG